jgi:phosphatidylglycerol:prolipoprotein diacylglycerol transferase
VIPFLHIGWLTIPTFGLMVALAMLVSFYVLRADLRRRGIAADAELFIAIPCLAGIVGAKLYHVLESPSQIFPHPRSELFASLDLRGLADSWRASARSLGSRGAKKSRY